VLIHGAPQVMALPIDRQKHLVEVPLVPWLGASTLQLNGVVLPQLQTHPPEGPFGQKIETLYGKRTWREHLATCHHLEMSEQLVQWSMTSSPGKDQSSIWSAGIP